MISLDRSLKIIRICLYLITAVFLLLHFLWQPFLYFAMTSLMLLFVNLAVLEVFRYNEIKMQIKSDYEVYLVKCYNEGQITKMQLDAKDKIFYPEFVKGFKSSKLSRMLFFLLWFGLAVTMLIMVLKEIF